MSNYAKTAGLTERHLQMVGQPVDDEISLAEVAPMLKDGMTVKDATYLLHWLDSLFGTLGVRETGGNLYTIGYLRKRSPTEATLAYDFHEQEWLVDDLKGMQNTVRRWESTTMRPRWAKFRFRWTKDRHQPIWEAAMPSNFLPDGEPAWAEIEEVEEGAFYVQTNSRSYGPENDMGPFDDLEEAQEAVEDLVRYGKYASGSTNARYLNSISSAKKNRILKAVAQHYGVSVAEMEAELVDLDAEDLYEYLAFDRSLAMTVYRDFQSGRFASKQASRSPSGMYGMTKRAERDCLACTRKVAKSAKTIARRAYRKDPKVAEFLVKHAARKKSMTAKILVAALADIGPKVAARIATASRDASPSYGLYGFREKTARLGLSACSDLRHEAGKVAYGLHSRRAEKHATYSSWFKQHSKAAKCMYSRLLSDSYPDA